MAVQSLVIDNNKAFEKNKNTRETRKWRKTSGNANKGGNSDLKECNLNSQRCNGKMQPISIKK